MIQDKQIPFETIKSAFADWLIQHHVDETERWARLDHREWEALAAYHWRRLESFLWDRGALGLELPEDDGPEGPVEVEIAAYGEPPTSAEMLERDQWLAKLTTAKPGEWADAT